MSEKNKINQYNKEAGQKYRKRKKEQDRLLEETKPGSVLRDNPDYDAIMEIIKKGG